MPVIKKGSDYMQAVTYTGNGSTQTINVGFQPDLVWIKSRSAATDHKLVDSVRGATLALISNSTGAETTDSTGVTAFTSTGFTLGANSTYNNNGATYVAWCWKKGATPGFDIVTYTGTGVARTVSHNLGVAPKMIIIKGRSNAYRWPVYTSAMGATKFLSLNETISVATDSGYWNNTEPTSSVFSLGTSVGVNENAATYVAYLFAEIAGFSKFGSFVSNGSTDGVFCYTGMTPRFILFKCSSTTESWIMLDTARNTYNVASGVLYPNLSDAESTAQPRIDFLSNGFKVRAASGQSPNSSGQTYIYAAFAENPFKYSLAR